MVSKKEISDALENNNLILLIVEPASYQKIIKVLLTILINDKSLPGVYFTSNQPASALIRKFESVIDISRIVFIDAVSQLVLRSIRSIEKCIYLTSPRDLTGVSTAIAREIENIKIPEGGKKFVIFDSLSTISIYNNEETIKKFAHYIANKAQSWRSTKSIFIATSDKELLVSEMVQSCDKIIKVNEITD